MANGLVLGQDEMVANWAFSTFNLFPVHVNRALGIVGSDGMLIGAILFQRYNGANVELSYYGPHTLTLGIVRSIARIVVCEFNASRLTLLTSRRNTHLRSSLTKLGFKFEGAQRCYYGHKDCRRNTAIRFVMFRDKMEWFAALPVANRELKQG